MPPQTITDQTERIASLDILRGLALIGMIVVHFHQGFRTTTPDIALWPGESLSEWVIWWGMEDKWAAVFAFLFGVGFAVTLRRAAARQRPILGFYLRRLLVLAVLGAAVEAFTGYAILIHLAISGLALLIVHRFSLRTLLVLAVITAVAVPLYRLGLGVHELLTGATPPPPPVTPEPPATYWAEVSGRLTRMRRSYVTWRYLIPSFSVTLFLLGLVTLRTGVFDDPKRHLRVILGTMTFGLASWLLFWLVLPSMPEQWHGWSRHAWPIRYGMGIVRNEWLALTYIGAVVLLLAYRPLWTRRLAGVGALGRMALTNYVLQAVIIYWLKSGFGLGLALRPYHRVAGALILSAVLAAFSTAWFTRFSYGPLEWLWRAFTRMEIPQLRRASLRPAAGV